GSPRDQSRCPRQTVPNSHPANQIFESRHHPQRSRTRRGFFTHTQLLRSDPGRFRLRRMRFLPSAAQRLPRSWTKRFDSLREKMKRFLRIFDLSKNEQRVIQIVILMLLALAFKEYTVT